MPNFNSHAHVERDGILDSHYHFSLLFQLTRSRGAWLFWNATTIIFFFISTHTLTWSVTFRLPICYPHKAISTHTLTWSVTDEIYVNHITDDISTHTLTWSVTNLPKDIYHHNEISTHTLTWSVTLNLFANRPYQLFQLTRSRGAWLPLGTAMFIPRYFNSHAHVERDPLLPQIPLPPQAFQLTRSRGAWRFWWGRFRNNWLYFNSHAHVERDVHLLHLHNQDRRFQLTRSRGAWLPTSLQAK